MSTASAFVVVRLSDEALKNTEDAVAGVVGGLGGRHSRPNKLDVRVRGSLCESPVR